jgi:hypothetical protein
MDFIEGLPLSGNYNVILVVIDKFTKYSHFIPLKHPFTAFQVAQEFMKQVYRLHGMPGMIISDRDRIFTSHLWKELFRLADTTLHMSSTHHPQTDGQSERLNQCLEGFLRCMVHSCPKKWAAWLPLAEYWYNTSFHSALGRTPFEVLYGYPPRTLGISINNCASAEARGNQKLSFRFFGPYKILQRVGEVAYKLELPTSSQVHPVIHVSQLKRHVPPNVPVSTLLASLNSVTDVAAEPI